jgi:CHAD domain-containing protein
MQDTFFIENIPDADNIVQNLKHTFSNSVDRTFTGIRRYYDTFDWRLLRAGYQLYSENRQYYLYSVKADKGELCHIFPRKPVYADDFAGTPFEKLMNQLLQMRALLPTVSFQIIWERLNILDTYKKTVARIRIEQAVWKKTPFPIQVKIISLRGFKSNTDEIFSWFHRKGIEPSATDLYTHACKLAGINPGTYSSKLKVDLNSDMTVSEAFKKIHGALFKTMRENEQGIIKDIDTEFLHDFRVSVRRIRALYSQVKKEIPSEIYNEAKKDFTWLGKSTNRMRDIDVYLLNKYKYIKILPADLKERILPFFQDMEKERSREHVKLVRLLKSARYSNLVQYWQEYFAAQPVNDGIDHSILMYARVHILKRFHRVLSLGQKVNVSGSDELLHKLRIECKKLRYLLEFYSSIFPQNLVLALIRQLKILQDNLGEFNDLCVQQSELRAYVDNLSLTGTQGKDVIMAVGFLISNLNDRQKAVRLNFAQSFYTFSSDKTIQSFDKLKMVIKT